MALRVLAPKLLSAVPGVAEALQLSLHQFHVVSLHAPGEARLLLGEDGLVGRAQVRHARGVPWRLHRGRRHRIRRRGRLRAHPIGELQDLAGVDGVGPPQVVERDDLVGGHAGPLGDAAHVVAAPHRVGRRDVVRGGHVGAALHVGAGLGRGQGVGAHRLGELQDLAGVDQVGVADVVQPLQGLGVGAQAARDDGQVVAPLHGVGRGLGLSRLHHRRGLRDGVQRGALGRGAGAEAQGQGHRRHRGQLLGHRVDDLGRLRPERGQGRPPGGAAALDPGAGVGEAGGRLGPKGMGRRPGLLGRDGLGVSGEAGAPEAQHLRIVSGVDVGGCAQCCA